MVFHVCVYCCSPPCVTSCFILLVTFFVLIMIRESKLGVNTWNKEGGRGDRGEETGRPCANSNAQTGDPAGLLGRVHLLYTVCGAAKLIRGRLMPELLRCLAVFSLLCPRHAILIEPDQQREGGRPCERSSPSYHPSHPCTRFPMSRLCS